NLFNTIITDSRAGKKRYSVHHVDIETAIAEGLYQRICQVTKKCRCQVFRANQEGLETVYGTVG
ncbi:hypothetical protein ACV8UU_23585, partial [Citrobacter freundii]